MQKKDAHTWDHLTKEPTVSLLQRIVCDSDRDALNVLLETRRLFSTGEDSQVLFSDYLLQLRERLLPPKECEHRLYEIADCAYDLTLAKYSNFPSTIKPNPASEIHAQRGKRIDCRLYYHAALHKILQEMDSDNPKSLLRQEETAGKILHDLVNLNFKRSRMECERFSPFNIRYVWEVSGVKISLKYPSYMTAKQFKQWLGKNSQGINLLEPDARRKIQNLINEKLKDGYDISIDNPETDKGLLPKSDPIKPDLKEGFIFVNNVADAVAKRKVRSIDNQRPTIQKLGKERLERMIKEVFEDLVSGELNSAEIAGKYGISKATFSRFAGGNWTENVGEEDFSVPDLWRNTAKELVNNPVFMETVLTYRMTDILETVLNSVEPST